MTLIDKIRSLQTEAKISGNMTVALLYTALINEASDIGKNRESTDNEVISVIKKLIKQYEEYQEILISLAPVNNDFTPSTPEPADLGMDEMEYWQLACHLKLLQNQCNTLCRLSKVNKP